MSETTKQFKKQLPKNVIMAIISFGTTAVTAIWLTPYLVNHLGAAAYGLVPLAALFTQYIALITGQLAGAVTRFLVVEMQKPDGTPNRIFNSAFALYSILALIQIPIFALGITYSDQLFTIPEGLKLDALLLLGCSAGAFLLSLVGGVFGVPLYSKNRLDIFSTIDLLRVVSRLVLIVVLFSIWGPKLRYIGYVDFILVIIEKLIYIYYWRKLSPELYIKFSEIDWSIFKPVFHMSFWSLVTQLGALLYERSDIWIINRFISPTVAGQYAAILVIGNFIRQISNNVSGQIAPTIITYWAKEDLLSLRKLLSFSVKILAFGLAIPVAVICANSQSILTLWLGEDFSELSMLLVVMVIHLSMNIAVFPIFNFFTASNTIRWPALVTFIMGFFNVAVSYYFGVTLGYGAMGVAVATGLMLILKNAIFTPVYSASVLKLPFWAFMGPLFGSVLMIGLVYVLSLIPLAELLHLNPASLIGILVQSAIICLIAVFAGWLLVITKSERNTVIDLIPVNIRTIPAVARCLGR